MVEKFGEIDVVYYGPSPHNVAEAQPSIEDVTGADVGAAMSAVYPAMDVVAKVLPSMLRRKTGTFLFTSAISAALPVPALGAMTVPAAAACSYAVTLNAALAERGVYVGVLVIGGLIENSDIHAAMSSGPEASGGDFALDPDRIADIAWDLAKKRKAAEVIVTPGRKGLGLKALLVGRLLRVPTRSAGARRRRA